MCMNQPAVPFVGAPVETDLARVDADVAILGVPHGWAYPRPGATAGCADAPAAVRHASQRMASFRGHWDFDLDAPMLPLDGGPRLADAGDVPGSAADGAGNSARTTDAVRAILEAGAVPVCIGGDDSVPIPILRAYEGRGPITVLQIDAHLDYRDEVDGVREGYSSPMRRAAEMAHVERIVHVGLRGVGSARPADVEDSRAAGNLLVPARQLRERGVPWLLGQIPANASVFLSFDCDGLDPSVFPAVSACSPGGLGYEEAVGAVLGVGGRLCGAVFTEFVPGLDSSGRSATAAARIVALAASGVTPHQETVA
jgi:agmatinase